MRNTFCVLIVFVVTIGSNFTVFANQYEKYFTCKPVLEYDNIDNVGNGFFVATKDFDDELSDSHYQKLYMLDSTGKALYEYDFKYIHEFGDNIYITSKRTDEGYMDGLINIKGEFITLVIYTNIEKLNEGFARFTRDTDSGEKTGFMDKNGKEVIPPIFDDAEDFSEGFAPVKINDKWGFVDKSGKFVIEPQYDFAEGFNEGLAKVRVEKNNGFINKKGETLIGLDDRLYSGFVNGKAFCWDNNNMMLYVIGHNGNVIKEKMLDKYPYFLESNDRYNGMCVVEKIVDNGDNHEHIMTYYNDDIEIISKKEYLMKDSLSEGVITIYDDITYKKGYADYNGNVLIPCILDSCEPFKDGYALVEIDGKYGIVKNPLSEDFNK